MKKYLITAAVAAALAVGIYFASDATYDIALPAVKKSGGMSLNEAIAKRRTVREFSDKKVSTKILSNILWAANGITDEKGLLATPTARDKKEFEVYVLTSDGIFAYRNKEHKLDKISDENLTLKTSYHAPLALAYVANMDLNTQELAMTDSGFVGQNVYLAATANGLGSVFEGHYFGNLDPAVWNYMLKLPLNKKIIAVHEIGYVK